MTLGVEGLVILGIIATMMIADLTYDGASLVLRERFASECAAGISRAKRRAALIRQAGAAPDHPAHPTLPETAYLKALVYALD